jgi:Carboxypeptidase regulatory-like domain
MRLREVHSVIMGIVIASCCCLFGTITAVAQERAGTITGVISDPTGAVIPKAQITATLSGGLTRTTVSDAQGRYVLLEVAPGEYQLEVITEGFETSRSSTVRVITGRTLAHNVQVSVAVVQQQVTVSTASAVDTEPANNASAMTLSGSALETLSDDPDDLAQDLQALAGPSAGPDGGEIYVDGFSGGKVPPKSAIREIRVNQNPFSAEYDRIGFGRIEILTKPGSNAFHGEARFNFGDSIFNSRNPFATDKPDYQRRMFEGTFSGPLSEKASFTLQVERRDIGQTAVINALVLDSNLNQAQYRESVLNPTTNTEVSGRLDYQLSTNHTLVGRYEWEKNTETNAGVDTFSLPSSAYNSDEREQVVQITETAILNPRAVHEVRFQYRRSHDVITGLNSDPTVDVLGAFTGGGSSMGLSGLTENRYEFHDLLSLARARHTVKLGGRLRVINESNRSMQNYNGVFTFTSLDAYRITETGLHAGLPRDQIRALGGGASQFTLMVGNPVAELTQIDLGLFVQDDWRVRNDLTLSGGLRFENQTNINDWRSWAPRLGVAWAPGSTNRQQPIAVLRAGFGVFYDRVRESLVLDARRLDGVHQQEFLIPNPDFYPAIPALGDLSGFAQQQAIRVLGNGLRAPYTQQVALSVERQLAKNVALSVTYTNSRGAHTLRSLNINAPLPGTYDPLIPGSGVRPFPGGNLYAYESAGRFRQNQFFANVNARFNKRYTLFGYYTWSKAQSDTDGAGSFPGNPYDLATEYGRAGFDVRHRAFIGGSVTIPFGISLNPFIVMHSGAPFNIITGEDLNGDSLFNDRPAWATDLSRPSVFRTRWGNLDTRPLAGQISIPRNLGDSSGMFAVNLRVSKSFGFGGRLGTSESGDSSGQGQGMGGPPGGHGPGGGHGGHHGPETSSSDRRYTVTFSIAARNLLNRVNLDAPVGNLSSPLFGQSTSIHGFGHGSASANRTIEFQTRFSF